MLHIKSLKVILDPCFVENYLKEQNKLDEIVQNISVISLNDSVISLNGSDCEAEKSVVFVFENEASREMKKIAKLNDKISQLTHRNRKLEMHVKALQTRVRTADDTVVINDNAKHTSNDNAEHTSNESAQHTSSEGAENTADDGGAQTSNDLSGFFDEEWANEQIQQWRDNGELSIMLKELENFVMDENLFN